MKIFLPIFLFVFAFHSAFSAGNGSEDLNHYALLHLSNPAVEADLTTRFKGTGSPLFLVHDLKIGVSQGDIIRFRDKAVFIDAEVWQTLKVTGALKALGRAPVVRLRAESRSSVWRSRSGLTPSKREQKAYILGGELLKILEDYFGGSPTGQEMVLRFRGNTMELLAPRSLIDALRFARVRKVVPGGKPQLVSLPPDERVFRGIPFAWTAWGADPGDPEGALSYSLEGELPEGLEWDVDSHTLQGSPLSSGSWTLVARVKNIRGRTDSLSFRLLVRPNQPPRIGGRLRSPAITEVNWSFDPLVSDPDHPADDVELKVIKMPPGMLRDPFTRSFLWVPADSMKRKNFELSLVAIDPLGDSTVRTFRIRVLTPQMALEAHGIRFTLPRDTLIEGHNYRWYDDEWLGENVKLLGVSGDQKMSYRKDPLFGKGELKVSPAKPGAFRLKFRFLVDGAELELEKDFPVRANRAPVFGGELASSTYFEGQDVWFAPAVNDPDGDRIKVEVFEPGGKRIRFDGQRMKLYTRRIGSYSLEFRAEDAVGKTSSRRIAYKVLPRDKTWFGLGNKIRKVSGISTWDFFATSGAGRLGIFSPDLGNALKVEPRATKEWAYGFIGISFLGERQLAKGNYLYLDAGLTLRQPNKRLVTGGLMMRMDARWLSPKRSRPWVFEFEWMTWIDQAVLTLDTSGLSRSVLETEVDTATATKYLNMSVQDIFQLYFGDAGSKLLSDNSGRNNAVLFIRFESWMPLGHGFWAAPVFWRIDRPVSGSSIQKLGLGLRHRFKYRFAEYEQSLRMGSGGSNSSFALYWDIKTSLGLWY